MAHHPSLQFAFVAALAVGLAAGQQARFRDEVFTQITRQNGIAYGAAVNRFTNQLETLLLDWYEPTGDTWQARPTYVVVHGGGFVGGGRGTGAVVSLSQQLCRAGYAVVSIDYRLAPNGSPITAQVIQDAGHDFQAAVRWLRANAATRRIDTSRIAAVGSSAGSYTVLASAYADLGEGTSGNPGFSSRIHLVGDLWGALQDVTQITANEPPLFIAHGTEDGTVPFARALALVARAQAVGLPYEFHPMQGSGHAPWAEFFQLHMADMLAFSWQHLRLAEVAGLAVRPGYASPGTVTVDQHGLAGSFALLALGDTLGNLPIPGLGVICLDPAGLVLTASSAVLPASPRVATGTTALAVPAGLGGFAAHWQAIEIGAMTVATNCVTTVF
jgi:acetyl esterase/lipase